jgi:phospholipid/cholesterol/gamma-HCH transport system substrate-binding protein
MSQSRICRRVILATVACALLGVGAVLGRHLSLSSRVEKPPIYVVVCSGTEPGNLPGTLARLGLPAEQSVQLCGAVESATATKPTPLPAVLRRKEAPGKAGALARADLPAGAGRLIQTAPPPAQTVQESLQKMQKSLDRLDKLAPETAETLREYRNLAKTLRDTIPELRDTNREVQKLIKSVNETVPTARTTLEDISVFTRNWSKVGERVNVLLQTNDEQIRNIIKNLDRSMEGIAEAFNRENRNDLATILSNLSKSSERFPRLTEETEQFFREGRVTSADVRSTLRRLDDVLDQFRGAKPGQEGQGLLRDLNEGVSRFNRLMGDARELLRAIGRSDGTIKRFLTDPSVFNHADDAALMLTRLIPRLDRMLRDFEVFADKLARHPESLGLGGLVRPSTGLKEAPSRVQYPPLPVHQP